MPSLVFRAKPSADQPIAVAGLSRQAPDPDQPVIAVIHGAFRTAEILIDWADRLSDLGEVQLVGLPGHGYSRDIAEASLEAITEAVETALLRTAEDRRIVLIGESLGGLVAMALDANARLNIVAVAAFDPPMSTNKAWSLHRNLQRLPLHKEPSRFEIDLAQRIFGCTIGRPEQSERLYFPLLDRLRAPTLIATGDVPLFPPRAYRQAPCLLDEADIHMIRRFHPGIRVEVVDGAGHTLLTEAPQACEALLRSFLDEIR